MHAQTSPRCIRFALALTLPGAVFAQTAPDVSGANTQQSAYRSSIAQETVRKQTDKIQEEINQLVTEAKLNGMDSAGLIALVKASSRLKTLSQEDMQKVIVALQSASMNTEDAGRQKSLVSAYQKQKDVSLQLKTLAADLAAQESQKALPAKLQSLIARQSANIRQTTTFASIAPAQLAGPQKSTHDVVSSEQASIGGEIDLLFKVLAAAPEKTATPDAPATPDTAKLVLEAMNNSSLKVTSDAAIKFTAEGPFPDAVVKETSIREYLTNLLRIAQSQVDAVTQLEEAKSQLNQLITDQKDLAAVAEQAKLDGATLAERQAKINDRTSVAQAQLKPLNQAAAAQVTEAQKEMEKSAAALDKAKTPAEPTQPKPDSEAQKDKDKTASADKSPADKAKDPADKAKDPADAAAQQKAVVDSLEKAAAMLDKQIADAQKQQDMNPADKLAQLEKLQSDIQQAEQNPQATPADLQKLQQDALAPSPEAANKIADAADKLQQQDKPAANQALAQAADAVKKQADELKQAAQDYQALAQASDQLAKAEDQAKAADDAIKNNTTNNQTEAARDLAQAQANVDQAKQQTGTPDDAKQAMQQASDALKEATNQAVQAQGAKAQAQGQKAQAAMQQAQKSLGQAMAQIQQQAQGQQKPGQKQQQSSAQAMNNQAPDQATNQLLQGSGGSGIAQVMGGLTPKDRDAISQLQAEKSPPEYAPQVQQYLKNLADSSQSR